MTDSEGDTQTHLDARLHYLAPRLLEALKASDINSLDADSTAKLLRDMLQHQTSPNSGGGGASGLVRGGGNANQITRPAIMNSGGGGGAVGQYTGNHSPPFSGLYNGESAYHDNVVSRKSRRPQANTTRLPTQKITAKNLASQVGYLCIADEFNLERMKDYYDRQRLRTTLEYDVLSVHKPSVDGSMRRDKDAFSIFLFKYGSVVFWGTPVSFKAVIEPDFVLAPRPNSEIAMAMEGRYPVELVATNFPVYCTYEIVKEDALLTGGHGGASGLGEGGGEKGVGGVGSVGGANGAYYYEVGKEKFERTLKEQDHFQLPSRNSDELKLCISHALAQSAKIEYMELKIQELTQKCKPLPRELKDKGSVTIAERSLLQLRGEVLYYRLMLKSGSDLLDEPELFWEHEQLKPYFYVTKEFFDISARVRVLDAKLDASNEILGMLSDQFSQRHSSRLEWIVIWLVLVEVIIGVLELMLDLKPWTHFY